MYYIFPRVIVDSAFTRCDRVLCINGHEGWKRSKCMENDFTVVVVVKCCLMSSDVS